MFDRDDALEANTLVRFVGTWSRGDRSTVLRAIGDLEAAAPLPEVYPQFGPPWTVAAHDIPMSGRFYTAYRQGRVQERSTSLYAPSLAELMHRIRTAFGRT